MTHTFFAILLLATVGCSLEVADHTHDNDTTSDAMIVSIDPPQRQGIVDWYHDGSAGKRLGDFIATETLQVHFTQNASTRECKH